MILMEVELTEVKENPFLKRKEILGVVTHPGLATPKRQDVLQRVAALHNTDVDKTIVQSIHSEFGIPKSKIIVHIYENKEDALKTEPKHLLKRSGIIEEEAK